MKKTWEEEQVEKFRAKIKADWEKLKEPYNRETSSWPSVDTSANTRRQVPEPWPWWYNLIGLIGGLIWFYVILKYLIANG